MERDSETQADFYGSNSDDQQMNNQDQDLDLASGEDDPDDQLMNSEGQSSELPNDGDQPMHNLGQRLALTNGEDVHDDQIMKNDGQRSELTNDEDQPDEELITIDPLSSQKSDTCDSESEHISCSPEKISSHSDMNKLTKNCNLAATYDDEETDTADEGSHSPLSIEDEGSFIVLPYYSREQEAKENIVYVQKVHNDSKEMEEKNLPLSKYPGFLNKADRKVGRSCVKSRNKKNYQFRKGTCAKKGEQTTWCKLPQERKIISLREFNNFSLHIPNIMKHKIIFHKFESLNKNAKKRKKLKKNKKTTCQENIREIEVRFNQQKDDNRFKRVKKLNPFVFNQDLLSPLPSFLCDVNKLKDKMKCVYRNYYVPVCKTKPATAPQRQLKHMFGLGIKLSAHEMKSLLCTTETANLAKCCKKRMFLSLPFFQKYSSVLEKSSGIYHLLKKKHRFRNLYVKCPNINTAVQGENTCTSHKLDMSKNISFVGRESKRSSYFKEFVMDFGKHKKKSKSNELSSASKDGTQHRPLEPFPVESAVDVPFFKCHAPDFQHLCAKQSVQTIQDKTRKLQRVYIKAAAPRSFIFKNHHATQPKTSLTNEKNVDPTEMEPDEYREGPAPDSLPVSISKESQYGSIPLSSSSEQSIAMNHSATSDSSMIVPVHKIKTEPFDDSDWQDYGHGVCSSAGALNADAFDIKCESPEFSSSKQCTAHAGAAEFGTPFCGIELKVEPDSSECMNIEESRAHLTRDSTFSARIVILQKILNSKTVLNNISGSDDNELIGVGAVEITHAVPGLKEADKIINDTTGKTIWKTEIANDDTHAFEEVIVVKSAEFDACDTK